MIQLSDEAMKFLKIKLMGKPFQVKTPTKTVMVWEYEGVLYVDKEEDLKAISEMSFLNKDDE